MTCGAVFLLLGGIVFRTRSLGADSLGSSDWIRAILGLFGSPCLGVYRRKESDRIESLGREILAFKDWARSLPHIYV